MSDKMRWRYGDTNPVMSAVDSATVIEIGDLVYLDSDDAKPASSQSDQSSKAANQTLFAGKFLGVAMQRSRAGDSDAIRVATSGVFEFDCTSGTFELGQHVGLEENAGGDGLLDQQVAAVAASAYAMGRAAKRASTAAGSILIEICSTIMSGGVDGTTA
ncbi:MAG: hypothetical protein U9N87_05055 [Planctomycetota bacterium]|nr:hypothetical protein [Planctomycetota bacterium]